MFRHNDIIESGFITCELNADDFELYQGDTVAPGSEIGLDVRSGSPVYLNCWGKVAAAHYNPMNHSYSVTINRLKRAKKATGDVENKQYVTV